MKINNIIIIFYLLISVLIGTILLGFSLHLVELGDIEFQLSELYTNINTRIAIAASGAFLILLALLFAQITSSKREREKNIAFNNPSGQVTITLYAVEDLIRKIGLELPQVKDIRPDVIATKKRGIQVNIRLILKSEANIPEFTAQLQEIIKTRIQEIFGIDEQIVVKIHVAKILTQPEKPKRKGEVISEGPELQPPYPRILERN